MKQTITQLNPATKDHVQSVLENLHYGKEIVIEELSREEVTYRVK